MTFLFFFPERNYPDSRNPPFVLPITCDRLRKRRCFADKELDVLLSPYSRLFPIFTENLILPNLTALKIDLTRKQPNENFITDTTFSKGNTEMCFTNQVMPSFVINTENILATKSKLEEKRFDNTLIAQKSEANKTKNLSFSVESIIGKK